jgi:hypothetical protein
MESWKKKDQKKSESEKFGYEDLLQDFSLEEKDNYLKKTAGENSLDMDEQALAELLGDFEDEPVITGENKNTEIEEEKLKSENIYDPANIIQDKETKEEDDGEELSGQDFKESEFVVENDPGGYESILNELEDDEPSEKSGSFAKNDADISNLNLTNQNGPDFSKVVDEDDQVLEARRLISLDDLEASELPVIDELKNEPALLSSDKTVIPSHQEPPEQEETDFLGLSGIPSKLEKSGKQFSRTDVLFDGVAMDFDEQINSVTLAELLLAQGKHKEAAEIFLKLTNQKGVTHWVTKRVRLLSTSEK